jgi:L-lactate dehydrogenase complex protein LldF
MDSGPKKADEIDGPEELFVIIVDNGRSELYQDLQVREVLGCIRCGACLNICPVYGKIGGYPYGWAYSGPMGQILNPLLLGLDRTQDLYRCSTLCGACKSVCPAGIDHPKIFLYFRAKDVEGDKKLRGKPRPWLESWLYKIWAWAGSGSWRWSLGAKLIRTLVNRKAQDGKLREMIGPLDGWFKNRDLPAMPDKTFHDRWKDLKDRKK